MVIQRGTLPIPAARRRSRRARRGTSVRAVLCFGTMMRFMAAWYTIRSRLDRARAAARLPGAYARPRCLRHRLRITSPAIRAHGSAGRRWRLRAKPARTDASRPARFSSLAASRGASRARRSSLEFDPFKPERGVGRRRRQPVLLGVRPSVGGDPGAPRAGYGALVREVLSRSADLAARPRRAARIWPYRRAFHWFLLSQTHYPVLGFPELRVSSAEPAHSRAATA